MVNVGQNRIEDGSAARILLILLLVVGWAIRILSLTPQLLWGDEVYSAAVANGGVIDVILAGLRYDIHPPLYYLQLHFWGLLGRSDEWLVGNSFLWGALTNISIFVIVRRLTNSRRALLAAALYAVLPIHITFATFLRMYTLAALIGVWIFYYIEMISRSTEQAGRNYIIVSLLFVLLGLVHGFGFFVGAFLLLYALVRLIQTGLVSRYRLLLILPVAGYLIGAAYALIIGSMRQTIGVETFDLNQIGIGLAITVFGFDMPYPALFGLLGLSLIILFAILNPEGRTILVILFILPLAGMIAVTLFKPVFTYRTAALFAVFLPLGFVGTAISSKPDGAGARTVAYRWLMAVTLVVMTICSLHSFLVPELQDYRIFAERWDKEAAPSENLFITGFNSDYMGFVRYLPNTPPQGAMDVQPPLGKQWEGIKRRLGEPLLRRLNMVGRPDHLTHSRGRHVYIWFDEAVAAAQPTYWLFGPDSDPGCGLPGFTPSVVLRDRHQALIRCHRTGA
ncbi:glycosyltransferase family 39 protein [Sphingomonas quercus]|uniref:Glycosyltransferase family 39 protein n=1 Tax=Sphingomonas quercus TaxID=2842451 RepID=A0ABS6BGZ8_9SPHN|nr:glycosyltransferase family 39 protein [Sphingomonas quercus]MBU3076746.1 glycosyltransferase family 39 protein [Sphingomonas quercus]